MFLQIPDDIRENLACVISHEYPLYRVKSFDVIGQKDDCYVLQNVRLEGIPQPSACGKFDGQCVPMIVAPSWMPFAGYCVKTWKPQAS